MKKPKRISFDGYSFKEWQELAHQELKDKPLDGITWQTNEGFSVDPLYTLKDLKNIPFVNNLPGFPPFIRGPYATMYNNRPWTIRQYAGFSTAEASNAFYKKCLTAGQQGLSVAFDLPTHRGYDSDHPRAIADVGKSGVAIDTVEDMNILFKGIPLDKVSVSMTMNGAVIPIMSAFIVAAEEQNVGHNALSGTIQNDILKEFMVRNTYIYPPAASMGIVADVVEYTSKYMPKFNSISISGYHMGEAGADAALELAYTLANGLEYVRFALNKGLKIDEFAPRLSFFFGIGMNFFIEIAKLRAARLLWAELMKTFNPQDTRSLMLRTHCQTSGWSLTAQDPYNNIIRTTIEALSAVLGGTQSLHTNSFDEAISLPTEFSSRIARNTQLILQEETSICKAIDPLGGSFYIEELTYKLSEKAREYLSEIESLGGMTKAIDTGLPKMKIEEAAAKRQARIDKGEELIVGVNKYIIDDSENVDVLEIDNKVVLKNQIERLTIIKKNRNNKKVKEALEKITKAAKDGNNLLEASLEATRLRATVGEITQAMEKVFGRYAAEIKIQAGHYISIYKDDEAFNKLRKDIEAFAEIEGREPRILIAKIGQDGHDRGAKIISTAFADLGFDVDMAPLFSTSAEIAKMAVENDVHIIGVSTLAGGHKTIVEQLFSELKQLNATDILVVVGGIIPKKDYDYLKKLGVASIFGPGTPVIFSAREIIEKLKSLKAPL